MGAIDSTKIPTGPTGKRGPPKKVDQTDPLSFGPKFPESLVEWIAPYVDLKQAKEKLETELLFLKDVNIRD